MQTGCRYRVDVVRWSTADVSDPDTHAITLDAAILDPHQHVARLRQVLRQDE